MEDADGTLWITSTETGISRYQKNKDNFIHVAGTPEDGIISLCQDSEGNIWAGSSRHGFYLLDRDNQKLIPRLTPKNRRSILQIRSIVERTPGELLLASDERLTQYGTHSGEWRTLKAQPGNADRLNDNYLQTLFFNREGALWVGTYFGGTNYFSPEGDNFRHYHRGTCDMDARIISVMAQADGNNLWIGTDDAGFFYWNRRENSFRPYRPANGQPDGRTPSYHNIHALLQTEDKLFVGMYMGGLDIMDLKSGQFRNYMPSPSSPHSLYSSGVYALCRDYQGEVWIGTTGGMNRYLPETDDFERVYEVHPADVSCIVDDPADSLLWVCSLNQGMFCLNRRQHQWLQYTAEDNHHRGEEERIKPIPTDRVVTACIDTQHRLWVGTDGHGLLRLDRENSRFVQVETGCDIRVVYKIMQQDDGLWLTTSDGLFCYHPESGITRRYNREDGLQDNQFQPNSGIALADGTLLVGGINGFNEFRPSQMVHTDTIRPTVILSDFQLSNRPVRVGDEGSPLKKSITYTESLTLHHRHSIFSLQVATPSYINPTRNRYRYKLEGFEKQWTESDVAPRVTYTNLPPGYYTFRDNGPGIGAEQQAKVFQPFYQVKENRPDDNIGTGIGLSLMKKLADLTDAELRLESEPGLGSTFILVLKPAVPQTEPVATPDSGITLPVFNEGSTADTTENERYRLIVCDDNLDMQHFLHDVLQDIYEVTCAGNGQEVLDLMKNRLPDLVISDVMMPVMDGRDLHRRRTGCRGRIVAHRSVHQAESCGRHYTQRLHPPAPAQESRLSADAAGCHGQRGLLSGRVLLNLLLQQSLPEPVWHESGRVQASEERECVMSMFRMTVITVGAQHFAP